MSNKLVITVTTASRYIKHCKQNIQLFGYSVESIWAWNKEIHTMELIMISATIPRFFELEVLGRCVNVWTTGILMMFCQVLLYSESSQ